MKAIMRVLPAVFVVFGLSACTLPSGAALQSEILEEQVSETPSFQVVPVTRANARALEHWPPTGWQGGYRWLQASNAPSSTVIRSGDLVNLVIWDSQDVSLLTAAEEKRIDLEGIQVAPDGTVFVPYVDDVVINGLTPDEARERIQTELERIVPSAQVQLSVEQGSSNSVDLVSGVESPGRIPLPGRDYTILSAIAEGGGISSDLRNPLVRLIRGGTTYEIRADTLFAEASRNATLRGGDKILVEEDRRSFTALGAAGTEDIIYFPKDEVSALEAVTLMGGLTDTRADPKGVLVLREYAPGQVSPTGAGPTHEQVVFTFDLTSADGLFAARNFEVNPGDTVLATESPVVRVTTIFSLVGTGLGVAGAVDGLSD